LTLVERIAWGSLFPPDETFLGKYLLLEWFKEGFGRKPSRAPPDVSEANRARDGLAGFGVPPAGIWRGDFPMMRGDGEETWNNGPGSPSRRPSGRKSARQIPAGTPNPRW
jgi:hypothetical protein